MVKLLVVGASSDPMEVIPIFLNTFMTSPTTR